MPVEATSYWATSINGYVDTDRQYFQCLDFGSYDSIRDEAGDGEVKRYLATFFTLTFAISAGVVVPDAAIAATVTATGTNPSVCNQEVGNATNVTAVRLAGGDCVVQFKNVGTTTWTVPAGVIAVNSLVIGGGGGGGFGSLGAGGGAGELLISGTTTLSTGVVSGYSAISVTPGSVTTVVVGGGGTSGAPSGATALSANWATQSATATKGGNGSSSSFGSVTADGGGGGGGNTPNINGQTGGSGGGSASPGVGGGTDSTGVSGWTSYKNGGETITAGNGGGGGAGGAGGSLSSGRGGAGVSISITGTSVKYAGGGGGWGMLGPEGDLNDLLLGGNGRLTSGNWPYAGNSNNTSPGAANTGTGGGAGAPGGSGIVIIRYTPDTTAPSFSNSSSFSFAENGATTSNAATISVNESATITITSGSDSPLFAIVITDSVTARIRFLTSPDYEAPADTGNNNVYDLSIRATDLTGNISNQSISVTVTNVNESTSISAPAISGTVSKGIATSITVTLNVPGKVGFFVSGKRISSCKAVTTSGSYPSTTATCSWRPAIMGRQVLTATLTPTDNSFSASTSLPTTVQVVKRTNSR